MGPDNEHTPDAPTPPEKRGAGTYQMLWDCRFCGTQKLLGLTHRHCPNCGAAQDPEWRYFPAEEDMVAVEDHQYVGADKICPACEQPNSAASTYCSECGADLATGEPAPSMGTRDLGRGIAEVHTRRDVVKDKFDAEMARVGVTEAGGRRWLGLSGRMWGIIGVVVLVLAIVGVIYAVTYQREASGQVADMSWERVIAVQVFQRIPSEGWQDQVPGDAHSVSCSERKRGEEQVQVGSHQECRDVDQGDGTFRRVCEAVPDYESRDVYDTFCRYSVNRWVTARDEKVAGAGTASAPYWPEVTFAAAGLGGLGQEREAARDEVYTVVIETSDGEQQTCRFEEEAEWSRFTVGMDVTFKAGISGSPDCETLAPVD